MFLQRFDSLYGDPKADMFGRGPTISATLKLPSKHLRYLLEDLLDGYRYRYTELGEREQEKPGKLEAHKHHQERLETHDWLMNLLSNALKDEAWKAVRDPSRKEQEVAPLFKREGGRKRKSACSEYELTNANKRLRLAEHSRKEEDDEEDGDNEDDGYDDEEDNEEDGDEQNDDDGDDEEMIV